MKTLLLLCTGFLLWSHFLNAQSQVSSQGISQSQIGSVVISYTVGQLYTKTLITDQVLITEGIQQPNSNLPTGILTYANQLLNVKVYPNPFMDYLWIDLSSFNQDEMVTCQILDISGHIIHTDSKQRSAGTLEINTAVLPAGVYLLRIFDHNYHSTTIHLHKIKA